MIALKCHTSQTFTSQSARSSTVQVQDVILTSLQKGREFPLSNITRSVPIKAEPNLFKLGNFVFTEDRAQFVHGLKKREHHCHVFPALSDEKQNRTRGTAQEKASNIQSPPHPAMKGTIISLLKAWKQEKKIHTDTISVPQSPIPV